MIFVNEIKLFSVQKYSRIFPELSLPGSSSFLVLELLTQFSIRIFLSDFPLSSLLEGRKNRQEERERNKNDLKLMCVGGENEERKKRKGERKI